MVRLGVLGAKSDAGDAHVLADMVCTHAHQLQPVAVLTVVNTQVKTLQGQVETHFGQHPAAEVITSQPGLGAVLGARVLAGFADDLTRYTTAKARKNYAGGSGLTSKLL